MRANSKRVPKGTRRAKHTNKMKLTVVDHFITGGSIQQTISHFFPSLTTTARLTMSKNIYVWRQQRDTLDERCATATEAKKRYNRAPFASISLSGEAECEILPWVNMLRADGVPVTNAMLREKAKAVAAGCGVSPFEAFWSWRKTFRAWHKLSIRARTRHGQITPVFAIERAKRLGRRSRRIRRS